MVNFGGEIHKKMLEEIVNHLKEKGQIVVPIGNVIPDAIVFHPETKEVYFVEVLTDPKSTFSSLYLYVGKIDRLILVVPNTFHKPLKELASKFKELIVLQSSLGKLLDYGWLKFFEGDNYEWLAQHREQAKICSQNVQICSKKLKKIFSSGSPHTPLSEKI